MKLFIMYIIFYVILQKLKEEEDIANDQTVTAVSGINGFSICGSALIHTPRCLETQVIPTPECMLHRGRKHFLPTLDSLQIFS